MPVHLLIVEQEERQIIMSQGTLMYMYVHGPLWIFVCTYNGPLWICVCMYMYVHMYVPLTARSLIFSVCNFAPQARRFFVMSLAKFEAACMYVLPMLLCILVAQKPNVS